MAAVYDSEENKQMNKDPDYFSTRQKDDPTSVILIEQGKEGKSIGMFEDPAVKPLIEGASHIYDSTVISSYF